MNKHDECALNIYIFIYQVSSMSTLNPHTRTHQNNTVALMIHHKLGQRRQKELITVGVALSCLHHLTAQLHHLQNEKKASHHEKSHIQSEIVFIQIKLQKTKHLKIPKKHCLTFSTRFSSSVKSFSHRSRDCLQCTHTHTHIILT